MTPAASWIAAVLGACALVGALVAWWRLGLRAARIARLLEDSEESRYALQAQAQTMVARLEAMQQVLLAQQRALDVAAQRQAGIASTQRGNDPADTISPSTIPAVLMRAPKD